MVRPEIKKKRLELAAKAVQSKRQRKKLEKIVQNKTAKINRKSLIEDLQQYQLKPEQLDKLYSTAWMQTQGFKKFSTAIQPSLHGSSALTSSTQEAQSLLRRKKRRIKVDQSITSDESTDTDAISTDTNESDDGNSSADTEIYQLPPPTVSSQKSSLINSVKQEAAQLPGISVKINETSASNKPVDKREPSKPAFYLLIKRPPDVEQARLKLPIINEEQNIMEQIKYNDIVIISGETGSGKTTQLPQFLYEGGYTTAGKMIGVTEPRRVAAISMSERVAYELSMGHDEVSYQIRFSGNTTQSTKIKFMTDGVLLRECQEDFLLHKYSVIIVDEAHERSIFSDILIGLLSRIVPMRAKSGNPLKLIIMSATLRVCDFTDNTFLFKNPPPIINIEARQFPVTVHFSPKTPMDFVQAAFKKARAIHAKMPKGGILIFVTSQNEVKLLCKMLSAIKTKEPLHCLGLYAMLPIHKQRLVFKEAPEGTRLCVIATNVAETSITIPNIKYVIDTGMEKIKVFNLVTGVSKFVTKWTSKSSADQRKGRAGRMGPGFCYRLYSSAVFMNEFPDYPEPSILQKPIEDVILQMKSMNIDNVVNFPFPTRPSTEALQAAERKLAVLGALDGSKLIGARPDQMSQLEFSSRLTPLGKSMSRFPVSARCAKLIVLSPYHLLPYVISLVAALTVREMFIAGDEFREIKKKWLGHGQSKLLGDFMVMLRAIAAADSFQCSNKLCLKNGLRTKAMLEIHKLRQHLAVMINSSLNHPELEDISLTNRPTSVQAALLRQLLYNSYCDHIARRIPDGEVAEKKVGDKIERKKLKNAYECSETESPVYICRESSVKGKNPDFLIYRELYHGDKKMYMRDVAVIEPSWLPEGAFK